MANELDEKTGTVNAEGRDVNVIDKQIQPKTGWGTTLFIVFLFFPLIIPGIVFLFMKVKAYTYLQQLQQNIQHDASQIDNYLEQRVQVLQNVVGLVEKATNLDKDTMTTIAAYRSGQNPKSGQDQDIARNEKLAQVDKSFGGLALAFENYPQLKSMEVISDAMQKNDYLQREITASRELYNDAVAKWNREIFVWPVKRYVASKNGYTTRVPFIASAETKERAREVFFKA